MAKAPEIEHLEKAVLAAQKVIEHQSFLTGLDVSPEEDTVDSGPEAP